MEIRSTFPMLKLYNTRLYFENKLAQYLTISLLLILMIPFMGLSGAYSQCTLDATLNYSNVSCFGGNDGSITISSPSGGSGSYEFSINGGSSWQASGSFSWLTSGTYNVMMRDGADVQCEESLNSSLEITQPQPLTLGDAFSESHDA